MFSDILGGILYILTGGASQDFAYYLEEQEIEAKVQEMMSLEYKQGRPNQE